MTSKQIENIHIDAINEILTRSGIECVKSFQESIEEESFEEEEELVPEQIEEAKHEEKVEEEENAPSEEIIIDESPHVFPSPSLRKVLPESIRINEDFNRLHVLPDKFNTNINPFAIPKILVTPPQIYIDILADLVGCKEYKNNLAEYWFLDTLANLLRRAQEDRLDISELVFELSITLL